MELETKPTQIMRGPKLGAGDRDMWFEVRSDGSKRRIGWKTAINMLGRANVVEVPFVSAAKKAKVS